MKLSDIFNVFSRQNRESEPFMYKVPTTLRNKILLFCRDVFSGNRHKLSRQDYTGEFWDEVHQALLYRHGRLQLIEEGNPQSKVEDAVRFLLSCKDDEFLDFVEYIFKVRCMFHITNDENLLVADINELFVSENAGYELTAMIKEEVVEASNEYPFFGREHKVIKTIAYPRIIRKDSQVIHKTVVQPALQLLGEPLYRTANQEFLEALEDYRKGDYGDCLTKCCSAFESVMKIICTKKKWPYRQGDTASTLVGIVVKNSSLDSYFEQPLIFIATLRNRLSKSHGAGVQTKVVSQHIAQYALNSTASAIILLINEIK